MLNVIDLNFDYPEKQVLQAVEFSVPAGTLLHLRGANGTGKTTLLKLLVGILHPERGDIRFKGQSIYADLPTYQQHLCYVGHKSGVNQLLTVREHCYFELQRGHNAISFEQLMDLSGLQGLEDTPCAWLSVGQRRRVALLRLLMSNVKLWFLDEPLVALDAGAVQMFIELLQNQLARGGSIILTSHQRLPMADVNYQEYQL